MQSCCLLDERESTFLTANLAKSASVFFQASIGSVGFRRVSYG